MSKKILLADDSVTIQKVVELTFMDEGVTVVAVGNGADAIARLAEVNPDVVIADVHMPGANGYEVSRKVKAWRPSLPVLLLVGTFEPFSKEEFEASGADANMKKPFDSQELLREVTGMLERSGSATPAPAAPVAAAVEEEPLWQLDDGGLASLPDFDEPAPSAAAPAAMAAAPVPAAAPIPVTAPRELEMAPPAAALASPVPAPPAAVEPAATTSSRLSDEDIDRVARRVVELLGDRIVREVSWEVIPDLAEVVIKDRLRELESQIE